MRISVAIHRRLGWTITLAVLLVAVYPLVKAQTNSSSANKKVAEIEAQQKHVETEIKETRTELSANEKKVASGLASLRKIDEDIAASQNEIAAVQGQLKTITERIDTLESSIASEETDLEQLRAEYLKAVKKMRVARKKSSGLVFLFASKNFNEVRRRMRYLQEFSEWRSRRSDEIKGKVAALEEQRAQLVQAKNDASVAIKREEAAQAKLAVQKAEQQVTVSELKAQGDVLKKKIQQRQADAKKMRNQISAIIAQEQAREAEEKRKAEEKRRAEEKALAEKKAAEERRLAEEKKREEEKLLAEEKAKQAEKETKPKTKEEPKTTLKTEPQKEATPKEEKSSGSGSYAEARKRNPRSSSSETATAESTFESMKGKLPKPAGGVFKIVSAFGTHAAAPGLEGDEYNEENGGIDAQTEKGAAATAVYDGVVQQTILRSSTPGIRNLVIVKHGDYYTIYWNLESVNVSEGQKVKQGQRIGTVGEDLDEPGKGKLHFEVWKNQTQLNPAAWIRI